MADLDYFKQINDSFGHASADATLLYFASILEKNLRSTDFSARNGGEEFVAVLPHTGLASALEIAEQIRSRLASASIESRTGKINTTVSIGTTPLKTGDSKTDDLLSRADDAFYAAKTAGRNRIKSL